MSTNFFNTTETLNLGAVLKKTLALTIFPTLIGSSEKNDKINRYC